MDPNRTKLKLMNYLNIKTDILRSEDYLGADPVERATWLNLLGWCASQENGGIIKDAKNWKCRKWQQIAGVTLEEVSLESALYFLDDSGSLVVNYYPTEMEIVAQSRREAGRKGGKATSKAKAEAARINGAKQNPSTACSENPSNLESKHPTKDKEKKDKIREDKEMKSTPPQSPAGGCPSPLDMVAVIPASFGDIKTNAAKEWAFDKQSRGVKRERFKSLESWKKCLKRMELYPETVVSEAVDCAICSGWLGWEHESIKSKQIKQDELKNWSTHGLKTV